jgi:hypothetical protein
MRPSNLCAVVAVLAIVLIRVGAEPNAGFNCNRDRGSCECDPAKPSDCDKMKANCLNGDIDKCSTTNGKTTCMCVVAERQSTSRASAAHPENARTH